MADLCAGVVRPYGTFDILYSSIISCRQFVFLIFWHRYSIRVALYGFVKSYSTLLDASFLAFLGRKTSERLRGSSILTAERAN